MAHHKRFPRRILLFTDFGESGPYTGQMEAVLDANGVVVPTIRLMSDAPCCNPRASAYLLAAIARYQPAQTLFLSVVDPGVGGERAALLVETEEHWFIGPDNGLLSQVVKSSREIRVNVIQWRPQSLSDSFHGRDLFAPVAASCARGEPLAMQLTTPSDMVGAEWPEDLAEVIYIDHYGNAFTGIRGTTLADDARLSVGARSLSYARTFSAAVGDRPFWYRNSLGLVEIAVNRGRADQLLGLAIGVAIGVVPGKVPPVT
ncbi:MAG: SAM-dependent chlorinase/fluorinase [Chromatiaceae bacterium]|nr:SAM-dependent chlorinase/fluorinase [Chromatiaceae bacterium]